MRSCFNTNLALRLDFALVWFGSGFLCARKQAPRGSLKQRAFDSGAIVSHQNINHSSGAEAYQKGTISQIWYSAVAWGGAGGARAPPIIWQTPKNIY